MADPSSTSCKAPFKIYTTVFLVTLIDYIYTFYGVPQAWPSPFLPVATGTLLPNAPYEVKTASQKPCPGSSLLPDRLPDIITSSMPGFWTLRTCQQLTTTSASTIFHAIATRWSQWGGSWPLQPRRHTKTIPSMSLGWCPIGLVSRQDHSVHWQASPRRQSRG